MSGLAAAILLTAGPSPAQSVRPLATLDILLGAAPWRAPDGTATWHDARAALGLSRHLAFDGCPVAPIQRDGCALVFDGRLDNRADLEARLPRGASALDDDAALACAAFVAWGAEAVARLEGAFAFVFWNPAEGRVIAGRDYLGLRPLHWTVHEDLYLFASDVAQLIAVRGVPPPDESAVADLLGGHPATDDRTLYQTLHRVPPGCYVSIDAAARGPRLQRYWSAEPAPVAASRSDQDWAEECRALLDRAVSANMRARGRTAVFFSGGVDSSLVLTVAAGVARRAGAPPPVPVSLVYDEPDSDERSFRDAVSRELGLDAVLAYPASVDASVFRGQAARRLVLPDLPADAASLSLYTAARSAGALVGLTGVGPDTLFAGSVYQYADLLGAGRVLAAARRYWLDRSTECSGWSPGGLLTAGAWPLLSAGQRTRLRRPARRLAGVGRSRQWLRLERTQEGVVADPPPGMPYSSWDIALALRDGWTSLFLETSERCAAEAGLDERHPFLDAAIVRFALSLPEDQRRRDRLTKFVLRRAVPELAPVVAGRTSKADFGHLLVTALHLLGGSRFFRDLAIGEAGWVDAGMLARRYDRATRAPADPESGADLPRLWMVAATELWFRAASAQRQGALAV